LLVKWRERGRWQAFDQIWLQRRHSIVQRFIKGTKKYYIGSGHICEQRQQPTQRVRFRRTIVACILLDALCFNHEVISCFSLSRGNEHQISESLFHSRRDIQ
jgi:hypothetical protein